MLSAIENKRAFLSVYMLVISFYVGFSLQLSAKIFSDKRPLL